MKPARDDSLDVLIVGLGAMACLTGAHLTRSGARTALAGTWKAGLAAVRERGVIVEYQFAAPGPGPDPGDSATVAVEVVDRIAPAPTANLVLVLVKAHQTASVAPYVAAALTRGGLAVTLQNGLGNREALARVVGLERVIAGTTSAGATLLGPGHVRAGGPGETVIGPGAVGPDASGPNASGEIAAPLANAARWLAAAGLPARVVPNVDPYLWLKLCVNAGINPVTALLGSPNEALMGGVAREVALRATSEAAAVATALGIELPTDPVDAMLTVVTSTRTNRSSMLQDIDREARTEIDAITGEVVRHARLVGVPAPVNDWLLAQVHLLEGGGDPQPLEAILEPAHS